MRFGLSWLAGWLGFWGESAAQRPDELQVVEMGLELADATAGDDLFVKQILARGAVVGRSETDFHGPHW